MEWLLNTSTGFVPAAFSWTLKPLVLRLSKSHLSDPERLNRLLIGAVLAYWWLTYLGVTGRTKDWDKFVHRGDRTDLSFFQLGWRIFEEFLRCNREIPFGLALLPQTLF